MPLGFRPSGHNNLTRHRVLLLIVTMPIAAWAVLITATFGMAALHGSDVVFWTLLGGASGIAVLLCAFAVVRRAPPTLWSSVMVLGISVLLTLPGTLLLYVFGKNPP